MSKHIPPLRRPEDMAPIRTQADLHQHWRALMGPLGFSRPALWIQFLGEDDRADGRITKVEELTDRPDGLMLINLMLVCEQLLDSDLPGGRVAFLYSRPGSRVVTDDDRAWAMALMLSAREAGVSFEPIHLATDEELRVFAPDDLALPRSAA